MAVNDARTGAHQPAAVVTPTAPAPGHQRAQAGNSPFSVPRFCMSPPQAKPTEPEYTEPEAAPVFNRFSLFGPTGPAMELGFGLALGLCEGRKTPVPPAPMEEEGTAKVRQVAVEEKSGTKVREIAFDEIRFESSDAKKPKIEPEETQSPWQMFQKERIQMMAERQKKNEHCTCLGTLESKPGPTLVCSSCTVNMHRACIGFGYKKPHPQPWVCSKCRKVKMALEAI